MEADKTNVQKTVILKIENLKKSFGKTEVLKNIDLNIYRNEIISVLGPSGCGKSTLLNIIAGLQAPDAGSVSVNGAAVSEAGHVVPPEKRRMNMVFQDFALWPHMSAYENIVYGLRRRKQYFHRAEHAERTQGKELTQEMIKEKAAHLIELLHLEGLENRYPAELSGGQQQRVAIARALITEPEILLMDEPLCNLDVQLRVEMRTEMAFLFRRLGTTVFHVTHDPSEAFAMADRIVVMNHGSIDQIDTPQNCYRSPKTESVAALLGAGNRLHAVAIAAAAADRNRTVVQIGGMPLSVHSDETGISFSEGQPVILRFRAENAEWVVEWKEENCIEAEVEYASFEGDCYRVRAKDALGEAFNFLSRTDLEKGTRGYVRIAPEHLYAYADAAVR